MSKSIKSFQTFGDESSARYLADHWPKGKLTAKRHIKSSNMYKFILCLSTFIKNFVGDLYVFVRNIDIDQADELLEEWEKSVKIPEQIPRLDTIAKRRAAVKRLISKIPIYNETGSGSLDPTTIGNYIEVLTGFSGITVITLAETSASTGSTTDYFYFIIQVPTSYGEANLFPLSFPIPFATSRSTPTLESTLNTVLERIIPAFCRWQIKLSE